MLPSEPEALVIERTQGTKYHSLRDGTGEARWQSTLSGTREKIQIKLPAQATRPLVLAPSPSVYYSGVPGGYLVWPLLQSFGGSSLNSHPGVEDANSGHSGLLRLEKPWGPAEQTEPWGQAADSPTLTNPQRQQVYCCLNFQDEENKAPGS